MKLQAFNKLICSTGEYWCAYIQSCLIVTLDELLKINFAKKHIRKLICPGADLPLFWFQVLCEWSAVNYKSAKCCTKEMLLIANSAIPSSRVFDYELMCKYRMEGITTLKQVLQCQNKDLPCVGAFTSAIKKVLLVQPHSSGVPGLSLSQPITVRAINVWLQHFNGVQLWHTWEAWSKDTGSLLVGQSWSHICRIH